MSNLIEYARIPKRPYPELYHLSFNSDLEGVWDPRHPDGDYDPGDDDLGLFGEPTDPRISVSPTLKQCFQAIYANVKHLFDEKRYPYVLFNVYQADITTKTRLVVPEVLAKHRLIHDAHITQEHCLLTPTHMQHVGRVKIYRPNPQAKLWYYAFDRKTSEYYGWLPKDVRVEVVTTETRSSTLAWMDW